MTINQISVFLENRKGELADLTGLLAENHINLRAISIAETSDYGVLRIIVDDSQKAAQILLEKGHIISMTPVVVVAVDDKPSGLNDVLDILAEGDMDIEYMYAMFAHQDGKASMVFRAGDEKAFVEVLSRHGLAPVDPAELGIK